MVVLVRERNLAKIESSSTHTCAHITHTHTAKKKGKEATRTEDNNNRRHTSCNHGIVAGDHGEVEKKAECRRDGMGVWKGCRENKLKNKNNGSLTAAGCWPSSSWERETHQGLLQN